MGTQSGNSKPHLLRKLKSARRDDLVGAVERGEVTTYQAAVEAGIRRRKRPLEVDTSVARRREFRRHPGRVRCDAEMWLGPGPASAFDTVEGARRYWVENRARLMPTLAVDGRRPWGWWAFEADICHPGRDLERSTLYEAGLLGAEEEAELLTDWRREFDRGHGPDFCHCAGLGKFLRDAAARHAHFKWADIPRALLIEWTLARRARARGSA